MRLKKQFPNTTVKFRGQAESANDSYLQLFVALIGSLILMLVILSLNFNSFYQARIILMVIPIGLASALLGHGIEGKPFSVLSMWGIIALLGILVNDAVVMVDTFNRLLKQGKSVKEAAFEAGASRFRPIILTSITTVVGLYPLIMEQSFQAQWLIPMAISVAYGVLFGTIFIILFLPLLLIYFNDLRRERYRVFRFLTLSKKTLDINELDVEPTIIQIEKEKKYDLN